MEAPATNEGEPSSKTVGELEVEHCEKNAESIVGPPPPLPSLDNGETVDNDTNDEDAADTKENQDVAAEVVEPEKDTKSDACLAQLLTFIEADDDMHPPNPSPIIPDPTPTSPIPNPTTSSQNNTTRFRSKSPAEGPEETWDFTLKPKTANGKHRGTIWISDNDFQNKLEEYDGFTTCEHEIIKIHCPCSSKMLFSICNKCHRVFCGNKCVKEEKDKQRKSEENQTGQTEENNTSTNSKEVVQPVSDLGSTSSTLSTRNPQISGEKKSKSSSDKDKEPNCRPVDTSTKVVRHVHTKQNDRPQMNPNNQQKGGQSLLKTTSNFFPHRDPQGPQFPPKSYNNHQNFSRPGLLPLAYPFPAGAVIRNSNPGLFQQPFRNQMPHIPTSQCIAPTFPYMPAYSPRIPNASIPSQVLKNMSHSNLELQTVPSRDTTIQQYHVVDEMLQNQPTSRPVQFETRINEQKHIEKTSMDSSRDEPTRILRDPWGSGRVVPVSNYSAQNNAIPNSTEESIETSPMICTQSNSEDMNTEINKSLQSRGVGRGFKDPRTSGGDLHERSVVSSKSNSADASKAPVRNLAYSSRPQNSGRHNINQAATQKNISDRFPISDRTVISQPGGLTAAITEEPFLVFGVPMMVGYSFGDSLFNLYVWNGYGIQANEEISNIIAQVSSKGKLQSLNPARVGRYCLGKYYNPECDGVDGWYRGRITGVEGDNVRVHFIDYGNDELLDKASIVVIPATLMHIRPSAIRICIGDFEKTRDTTDEHLDYVFNNFIANKFFRVIIYEDNSNTTLENVPAKYDAKLEVKYEGEWVGVADILAQETGRKTPFGKTVRKKSDYPCDDYPAFRTKHREVQVQLSHVKDLNDFFIVRSSSISDRDRIMAELNAKCDTYYNYPKESWMDTNYVCVAQRKDGQWARAKLTEILDLNTVEVRFIDFGDTNVVSCDQLKSIPVALLSIPQLAYRCSLPIFPTQQHWDDQDPTVHLLKDIPATDTIFIVVFALETERSAHIVEVFLGESVNGFSKTLLKKKADICYEGYTVDLDIRKKLRKSSYSEVSEDSLSTYSRAFTNSIIDDRSPGREQEVRAEADNKKFGHIGIYNKHADSHGPNLEHSSSRNSLHLQDSLKLSINMIPPSRPLISFLTTEFRISHILGYNRICIKPKKMDEFFLKLQDEIVDCIDADTTFTDSPPLNLVVVAPYRNGNYSRAVVKNVVDNEVTVQFLDFGSTSNFHLGLLKPALPSIMKFPKFCYEVKLLGVEDCPGLLLASDFHSLMKKAMKLTYTLESCTGHREPYTVAMQTKHSIIKPTISETILAKQIWEWESLCNFGYVEDEELFSKMNSWKSPAKVEDILTCQLPIGVLLEGDISTCSSEGDFTVASVNDDIIRWDQEVLQNQIARFVEKVSPTAKDFEFYPVLQEVVLIYLPDVPDLQKWNLKGLGRWNRCLRETTDYYRNLDIGEIYPDNTTLSKYFEIRRLCPEFLRVPVGLAECVVKNGKCSPALLKMSKELRTGRRIQFTVDAYDESNFIHLVRIEHFLN